MNVNQAITFGPVHDVERKNLLQHLNDINF